MQGLLRVSSGCARVAAEAARREVASHPGLRIVGVHHGYFDKGRSVEIAEMIRRARPHMLFVGMESPWREYWISGQP